MQIQKTLITRHVRKYDDVPERLLNFLKRKFTHLLTRDYGYRIPNDDECKRFGQITDFYARLRAACLTDRDKTEIDNWGDITVTDKQFQQPRGLFLYGTCGTGKTFTAAVLAAELKVDFFDVNELNSKYMRKDGDDWFYDFSRDHCKNPIIIDDLGAERNVRKYGSESIISDLISVRSKYFDWFGTPTIFTSNFSSRDEIKERYGDRIESRISGMCEYILIGGDDKRKAVTK